VKLALDVSAVPRQPAGAGRYIAEIATRLVGSVSELHLVTRRNDATRWRQTHPTDMVHSVVPSTRAVRLLYEAYGLGRTSLARAVDVWHSPHYSMPHHCAAPVVVTIHDLTYFTHPEYHERSKVEFFTRAIRFAAREAAVLVAVSEYTANELRELCPTDKPIVVAPHGVDLERFSRNDPLNVSVADSLPDLGVPYVLFVGTFEPRKGIDVLVEAFREVAAADLDLELWLVGQSGWHVEPIEALIATHPFAARIRRLGYVADDALATLLRHARVVVYPSRGEGFGLPVLEALACGAPVITTDRTVMAEVAGDAAVLVDVGDAKTLATQIASVLSWNDVQRQNAAARGRGRAEEYTWDRSVAQHLAAYELAAGH
jgi:glycosyltransferase involved in cell wall biosynthesis